MPISTKGGYTLLEVLVTFAILGMVAVPLALFLASVTGRAASDGLLNSAALAANAMEALEATGDFRGALTEEGYDGGRYFVEVDCRRKGDLVEVFVRSGRAGDGKALFSLYRCFYAPQVGN